MVDYSFGKFQGAANARPKISGGVALDLRSSTATCTSWSRRIFGNSISTRNSNHRRHAASSATMCATCAWCTRAAMNRRKPKRVRTIPLGGRTSTRNKTSSAVTRRAVGPTRSSSTRWISRDRRGILDTRRRSTIFSGCHSRRRTSEKSCGITAPPIARYNRAVPAIGGSQRINGLNRLNELNGLNFDTRLTPFLPFGTGHDEKVAAS